MLRRAALVLGILSAVAGLVVADPAARRAAAYTYVFRQDKATLTLTLPASAARAPRATACARALHDPLVFIRAVAVNRTGGARFEFPDTIAVGLRGERSLEFVGLDAKITADRWAERAERLGGDLYERCAVNLWNELSVSKVALPGAQISYLYAANASGLALRNVQYLLVADPITIGPGPVVLKRR